MALRDRFSKIASYFGSDDLDDTAFHYQEAPVATPSEQIPPVTQPVEEEQVATVQEEKTVEVSRPVAPTSRPSREIARDIDTRDFPPLRRDSQPRQQFNFPERPAAPSSRPQPRETARPEPKVAAATHPGQTRISLKHPLRYEDATTIADLFLDGQCVLVDFEYMQEPQARRCIDFLTGACRVVNGNFQRIGATIYLLTPTGVVVDIEDVRPQTKGQDVGYDYDMKRR